MQPKFKKTFRYRYIKTGDPALIAYIVTLESGAACVTVQRREGWITRRSLPDVVKGIVFRSRTLKAQADRPLVHSGNVCSMWCERKEKNNADV